VPLLLLAFIVVPLVELYVIIQVGQSIGVLPTIGLLLADSILGSLLMRSQGRAAWRAFRTASASGRVPAREVLDGALVIFGGALLLAPGFVTDLLGVALLAPPTRAVVRRMLVGRVTRSLAGSAGAAFGTGVPRRRPGPPPPEDTVDGTARDRAARRLP
jgi:UPF0716 protein FxsA